MDPLFAWIETSALSEWIRGSDCVCAFPTIVTLHNVGMAFLAGGGIAIDLRIIGFAPGIPLKPMGRPCCGWRSLSMDSRESCC